MEDFEGRMGIWQPFTEGAFQLAIEPRYSTRIDAHMCRANGLPQMIGYSSPVSHEPQRDWNPVTHMNNTIFAAMFGQGICSLVIPNSRTSPPLA